MTLLSRHHLKAGAYRRSSRSPGEPHSYGPTLHRLAANSRGTFGAIVSADQAAAWLRLPSQTPPKEGCVDTTLAPSLLPLPVREQFRQLQNAKNQEILDLRRRNHELEGKIRRAVRELT
jgi:hypothetical protein